MDQEDFNNPQREPQFTSWFGPTIRNNNNNSNNNNNNNNNNTQSGDSGSSEMLNNQIILIPDNDRYSNSNISNNNNSNNDDDSRNQGVTGMFSRNAYLDSIIGESYSVSNDNNQSNNQNNSNNNNNNYVSPIKKIETRFNDITLIHSNTLSDISNIFTNMDLQSLNLSGDELREVYLLHDYLKQKFTEYIEIIDRRRNIVMQEIDQENFELKKLHADSNSHQSVNVWTKLQRVRLRIVAGEIEEAQKIRVKFLTIIDHYKNAVNEYSEMAYQGRRALNPTSHFQQWVHSINPSEPSNMTKELKELYSISKNISRNTFSTNNGNRELTVKNDGYFPLKQLPSEILHLVLDKLSHKADIVRLLTVCKLWAQLIVKILYYRPQINKRVQLELFMRTMRLTASDTIFDYRSMIKRLNFSFVGDYLHDEELYNFIGCKNLERLTLVFCKHITSSSIAAVLKDCRYLQSVDITGIKDISDSIFEILADNCPRLQGFYVPQAKNVTFPSLNKFIINAPILKRVKITANNNMDDELVELLADRCPMLVEVDITLSPNVHDESLLKLFTKLGQLREFRITHNTNISDKLLLELSKNVSQLPALRLLDFSGCENITDKTIERIVMLAPKLRNVFLGKCSRITDTSLYHLAKLGKNLQTVHFGHCFNITDQGVRVLVQSCPRIQYVDFACCTNLTNRTLYELSDLTKLKRIGLVKCSQMTDEGLLNMISLRGRNDSLERVHLSYCSNLTIYPIYELLMACPRLSHLSLTAVPSFLRPDITAFCRPAPTDFSDNQRQIFCVFSGKGVHKLRHYLMSLTTPTSGPQTDIREVLTKYVILKNMLLPNEDLETGLHRITTELNQDSSAILAAAGLSQMNGVNNDMLFQNIDFERLDDVFNWYEASFEGHQISSTEINQLLPLVDKKFCEDPFDEEYDDAEGIVAPNANSILNSELCHIVRKFHELDDRVDDFEVNVASLARVQFQFTGFLLHEMVQIHMQMIDINRQITEIQKGVLESENENNIKGVLIWRLLFTEKFSELLQKFKLSTVVLRLYLKDSITLLTRQRELILANRRNTWNTGEGDEQPTRSNLLDQINTVSLSADELNILQLGDIRTTQISPNNALRPPLDMNNINQMDTRSDTPDDDTVLEEV
ncbi:hypothetical protein Kpol_1010p20 [Vanderwaltozyma polyspora DSM 70294]|uniref:F-box domain-containing protein n=1 Tax=Vanderwaltozyma polyspora (strain ATCC 22028 / DSM 70294 / BCRC 21397 / CBS 2163 / NBRC 10782 / NRRL Y-8283 / UCD 57-17) TaxID=436907 RepID=A7TIG7_VANPO|nr:uncharacterized protein Kpol_1010p20 [Vanderwaltozyma polyspora DSM 70294]EDO17905.1 hypothetical protein Kpol_1010p20 [Vanderwaltozyma polyspora DSM 70294]